METVLAERPRLEYDRAAPETSKRLGHFRDSGQAATEPDLSGELSPVGLLLHSAARGNPQAWQELLARFSGMIAAIGRRHRLCPADLAELQQTTWLRLIENIERIEYPERVGGWLATTARRESLQILRKSAKYAGGADELLANMPDRRLPEMDARPLADERDAALAKAWSQLKPRCRELLALMIGDDAVGYTDLSRVLNMPIGSIGPTRGRCLEHLRRLLDKEGITGR